MQMDVLFILFSLSTNSALITKEIITKAPVGMKSSFEKITVHLDM